ncbi:MAG TPA: glycerophosphodiester phosphodiesterase [Acidimicrobiales bacterium]|jgi:glycerophosphoryl diester phosphodiesterase|nr:glycerophosphodiester phosphodiesterase [Acidimicrobiales bacterium]
MTVPSSPWPFLDHAGPLAFAHQGGGGEHPENTMAAFDHAVSLGYRYLETDVHATADGVLVAFHDDCLERMTDHAGRIADLPWSVVRQARVGGDHRIPRLEDVLGSWPRTKVNIDPKHDAAVEPLVQLLRRTRSLARVAIGSFSDRRLHRIRRALGPTVCLSLGPLGVARLRGASVGLPTGRLAAACVQVPVTAKGVPVIDARFVEAAHRRGLQVHAWTIDEAPEMVRLLDLGVDGIMTDRPSLLRQVLAERGQWVGP